MSLAERWEAWRDQQLVELRRENARLRAELEAVDRALGPATKPPVSALAWDWAGVPFPRKKPRRQP
jgi:hypothetical protein